MQIRRFFLMRWVLVVLVSVSTTSFTVAQSQTEHYVRPGVAPYVANFLNCGQDCALAFNTPQPVNLSGINRSVSISTVFVYLIPIELYDLLMKATRSERPSILQRSLPAIVEFNKNYAARAANPFACIAVNSSTCGNANVYTGTNTYDDGGMNLQSFQQNIVISYLRTSLLAFGGHEANIARILNKILDAVNKKSDPSSGSRGSNNRGSGLDKDNFNGTGQTTGNPAGNGIGFISGISTGNSNTPGPTGFPGSGSTRPTGGWDSQITSSNAWSYFIYNNPNNSSGIAGGGSGSGSSGSSCSDLASCNSRFNGPLGGPNRFIR